MLLLLQREGLEMNIAVKIDNLIDKLSSLKPNLSDDKLSNERKFNELLQASIEADDSTADKTTEIELLDNVVPSYGYDAKSSRKPNIRELMEAMTGRNLEDLYTETDGSWQKVFRQASEILYGVVGSNEDTRDWQSIMASENILSEAQKQTSAMHGAKLDIQSSFDANDTLIEQIAVIKDKDGNTLRSLSNNNSSNQETLTNFGFTKESIPAELENRIDPNIFDENLNNFLKNFDNSTPTLEEITFQSASEAIASKLSHEIPLDELDKL